MKQLWINNCYYRCVHSYDIVFGPVYEGAVMVTKQSSEYSNWFFANTNEYRWLLDAIERQCWEPLSEEEQTIDRMSFNA